MIIEKVVDKDEMIRDLKLFKKYYFLPFKRVSLIFIILLIYGFISFLFECLFSNESTFKNIYMFFLIFLV